MENLLRHIRRRCLAVGCLSAAVFLAAIGLLIFDSSAEVPPSWFDVAYVVCCLGSVAVLTLSGWQLRQERKIWEDDSELLKKVEKICWEAVAICAICGVCTVLDSVLFNAAHAGTLAGACLGTTIWNSFWVAGTLDDAIGSQADDDTSE